MQITNETLIGIFIILAVFYTLFMIHQYRHFDFRWGKHFTLLLLIEGLISIFCIPFGCIYLNYEVVFMVKTLLIGFAALTLVVFVLDFILLLREIEKRDKTVEAQK